MIEQITVPQSVQHGGLRTTQEQEPVLLREVCTLPLSTPEKNEHMVTDNTQGVEF